MDPELDKPGNKEDLSPPEFVIGDQGWSDQVLSILRAYEVPAPEPVSDEALVQRESQLGISLPMPLRRFLAEIGPVNFDGIHLYTPDKISVLDSLWFADFLDETDRARLPSMLGIADHYGSGDVVAMDLATGRCCLYSHDPPGISWWLPSFADLIRVALIDLSWGYYGWDDPEIEAWADELKRDLYGVSIR